MLERSRCVFRADMWLLLDWCLGCSCGGEYAVAWIRSRSLYHCKCCSLLFYLSSCCSYHVLTGSWSGHCRYCVWVQITLSSPTDLLFKPHTQCKAARVTCHQGAQSVSSSRHHLEIHRFTRGGLNMHMSSIEISFIVGILPVPEIMLSSNQPSLACFPG